MTSSPIQISEGDLERRQIDIIILVDTNLFQLDYRPPSERIS
jgi:hypothetical protein